MLFYGFFPFVVVRSANLSIDVDHDVNNGRVFEVQIINFYKPDLAGKIIAILAQNTSPEIKEANIETFTRVHKRSIKMHCLYLTPGISYNDYDSSQERGIFGSMPQEVVIVVNFKGEQFIGHKLLKLDKINKIHVSKSTITEVD